MQVVIDANILFSALIKDSFTVELLVNNLGNCYAPEFILEEFYKHKTEIIEKTKRTPEDFDSIFEDLHEMINLVPKEEYENMLSIAEKISPDPNDVPYFALALKLNISLWSNDKKLKQQARVKVYSTTDLIESNLL